MGGCKVIICPGNGCTSIRRSNWYGQLYEELRALKIDVVCENFPDPFEAKRSVWLPYIESLGADENSILVGHSSGAQAALRYAETHKLKAVVLVSATFTDLGDAGERASGYYPQGIYLSTLQAWCRVRFQETCVRVGDFICRSDVCYDIHGSGEENPYEFEAMKRNCACWHQFHSDDDPFIPLHEAERIRDGLGLTDTYYMLAGRSHFFEPFSELTELVVSIAN